MAWETSVPPEPRTVSSLCLMVRRIERNERGTGLFGWVELETGEPPQLGVCVDIGGKGGAFTHESLCVECVCVCWGRVCDAVKFTEIGIFLSSFPSEHFGKLFGLVMALSAIVSLLQFPLFKVSPESKAVYVSMGLAIFLTLVHPILVYREFRAEKTKPSATSDP